MLKIKNITAVILILAVLGEVIFLAVSTDDPYYSSGLKPAQEEGTENDTLILWYTDENLTEYLETEALTFQGQHGVKLKPELVSGVELLEQINKASIYEGEEEDGKILKAPDLYITSHDNLMKAYYSGLASVIPDADISIVPSNYPETSIHAVTCNDKVVAYPFYFETNFLLYNKTFMANIARQKIEDEGVSLGQPGEGENEGENGTGVENGNEAETETETESEAENGDPEVAPIEEVAEEEVERAVEALEEEEPMGEESYTNDPKVLERLSTMIPSTITDITTFANNYEAPDTVEAVFKWDISDIFYNYFFVGNYMDLGGINGDNNTIVNLYNNQVVDCMRVYQEMNKFFSIDAKEVNYESILNDFIEGKLVFTVATTDAIEKIETAKANGEFEFDYGVAVLPDVSSTLKSRGMSVTDSIVVNGYSRHKDMAAVLAHYLAFTRVENLYKKAGKLPCRKYISFDNDEMVNIYAEYEKSVSLPKMIEAADYWVQLEIAFTKVWNGEDADAVMMELSESIGDQIDELDYHVPIQEQVTVGM